MRFFQKGNQIKTRLKALLLNKININKKNNVYVCKMITFVFLTLKIIENRKGWLRRGRDWIYKMMWLRFGEPNGVMRIIEWWVCIEMKWYGVEDKHVWIFI